MTSGFNGSPAPTQCSKDFGRWACKYFADSGRTRGRYTVGGEQNVVIE